MNVNQLVQYMMHIGIYSGAVSISIARDFATDAERLAFAIGAYIGRDNLNHKPPRMFMQNSKN